MTLEISGTTPLSTHGSWDNEQPAEHSGIAFLFVYTVLWSSFARNKIELCNVCIITDFYEIFIERLSVPMFILWNYERNFD
jgi:hypothetical protein